MLTLVVAAGLWLAIGAVAAAVMGRRGHDTFAWAVLFLFLGPLAVPLAVSSERHRPEIPESPAHDGSLDVLVVEDGSSRCEAALRSALDLLGDRMTSLSIATVVDAEANATVRGRETIRAAQARVDALARAVASETSAPIDTVVLCGAPADVVPRFASEKGYELVVTGCPTGRTSPLGTRHGRGPSVPMLIGPST